MRKTLALLSLWCALSILGEISGSAACTVSVSAPASGSTFSVGSSIPLTASLSGCGGQTISYVTYFNGATPLGSASSSPYSFTWNTTGQAINAYSITAVAYIAGSAGAPSTTIIDVVGTSNPAGNATFGEGGAGTWTPGDNQMCSIPPSPTSPTWSWPYNGATDSIPDGTCEWTGSTAPPPPAANQTVDNLDDTMHTLSDFVNFSTTFLNNDVYTLSSTFNTWYPQVDDWINPSTGRLWPVEKNLTTWSQPNNVISTWLSQTYTNSNAWCLPPNTTGSANEDAYINSNSGGSATWGDLPHVIACLNYNSNQTPAVGSVYNYQQCFNALTSGVCPAQLPAVCAASTLGRSLLGVAAPAYNGSCDTMVAGSFAKWVSDSFTLATDEAPKFALRSAFLTDVYNRATTMQTIFPPAASELQSFLTSAAAQLSQVKACDDGTSCTNGKCTDGTACTASATATFPNSVIYGWQDNLPGGSGGCTDTNGQRIGCVHIVKVTAYSPGRCGGACSPNFVDGLLPWIKTSCTDNFLGLCLARSYTLTDRDEYVYVSIKRWDQDHGSILFPNGHPLWQFSFHNPSGPAAPPSQGISGCLGTNYQGSNLSGKIGIGFTLQTAAGLGSSSANISSTDTQSLANAFMLNFNTSDNGAHDPNSGVESNCLAWANQMLTGAPESHACAAYIASNNASGTPPHASGDTSNDTDYSLKFVDCKSIPGFNASSLEDLGNS